MQHAVLRKCGNRMFVLKLHKDLPTVTISIYVSNLFVIYDLTYFMRSTSERGRFHARDWGGASFDGRFGGG